MKLNLTFSIFLLFLCAILRAQSYTQPVYSYDSIMDYQYGIQTDYAGNQDTLLLDIYKPHGDGNCLRPVIVLVHGGSWVAGSKEDVDLVYLSRNLAKRGWVVANINYRLGTHKAANYTMYAVCNTSISAPCGYICDSSEIYRANFRGMQDTKGVIRMMKTRHLVDSSDVNNVFVAGQSAGGFIAFAAAFTDQLSDKSADCYAIANAPTPDPDFATYGCNPAVISFARPDLGSIDGTLYTGTYDASVKGIGNFFGGVMDLSLFNQVNNTPAVYMFHQGSDVIVDYQYNRLLGRISWECYAQSNICQTYYFYPRAYGSEGLRQYFVSLGAGAPLYQADIVSNYNYMNNCFDNGHSVDNLQLRLQNMVNMFSPIITASGNDPLTNCQAMGISNELNLSSFIVSPNPAQKEINLQFMHPVKDPVIRIYSSIGKLVYEEKLSSGTTMQLHLETNLSNGCYFITVESEQQRSTRKFFISK
ncbi:MAG: carboxylesterase family protein [Bacteroidota bacterium]|nr:carboxylesterase family protein [Bacteroidota bacterium]